MRSLLAVGILVLVVGLFAGAFYLAVSGYPANEVVKLMTPGLVLILPVIRFYFR